MVTTVNIRHPMLVEINNIELEDVQQAAQFKDPYDKVWSICWDTHRQTAIILGDLISSNWMVDCNGTNKEGWEITLKDVMRLLGYDLDSYRLDNVWTETEMESDALHTITIKELPLCQFTVSAN
jgi:hypothetical protein